MTDKPLISRILSKFGTEWVQIVIISNLAIAVFGLADRFNPGSFSLGLLVGLAVSFVFRHAISGNFTRNFIIIAVISAAIVCGDLFVLSGEIFALNFSTDAAFTLGATARGFFAALLISFATGFLILSYQKQPHELYSELPENLKTNVDRQVRFADFIHRNVVYDVNVRSLPDKDAFRVTFSVEMTLVNRAKSDAIYTDTFIPSGTNVIFELVTLGGQEIDTEVSHLKAGDSGVVLKKKLGAGEDIKVFVKASSTYENRSSELYSSYFPCEEMTLNLSWDSDDINMMASVWCPYDPATETLRIRTKRFHFKEGLLPYQGIRLFWATEKD